MYYCACQASASPDRLHLEQPKPKHAGAVPGVPAEQGGQHPAARAPDTPYKQGQSKCLLPNTRLIQTEKITCFSVIAKTKPLYHNWQIESISYLLSKSGTAEHPASHQSIFEQAVTAQDIISSTLCHALNRALTRKWIKLRTNAWERSQRAKHILTHSLCSDEFQEICSKFPAFWQRAELSHERSPVLCCYHLQAHT